MSSSLLPHVLLVSAPLQGHVNPLLVLGRHLASRGLLVTFSTAPHGGLKLGHGDGATVDVGRGSIRFEHLKGGALGASGDPRYHDATSLLLHVEEAAPPVLEELIRRQSEAGRPVSCVVASAFAPWVARVASSLGVPHAVLFTESCAVLSLFYHYFHSLAEFPPRDAGPDATVAVPGLPPLAAADLPGLIHAPEEFLFWRQMLMADIRSLRETVTWVLVNTFDELERPTIEGLRSHLPVIPVGPLFNGTDTNHDDDDGCVAWLDAQPPRSVVYVAFGSVLKLGREEMSELAEGLAATGRPFLLVARDDNRELLPDDCLAAATGGDSRGRVVPWCKQARVLSHGAVGCFVTHCGWNSTLEALASGVPVVTFPDSADQPTNARVLEDVYSVGVRLPKPIARDALRRCVEEVMSGPNAAAMRAQAGKWKAEASAALSTGGSLDKGIQDFVAAILATCPGSIEKGNTTSGSELYCSSRTMANIGC